MRIPRGIRLWGLVLLVLLTVGVGSGPPARAESAPDDEAIEARAFRVRYQPVAEAYEIVAAVLSEDGSITLKPGLKTLVVQDRLSVLDRVGPLLESFDLPPRSVDVVVNLAMGSEPEHATGEAGRHIGTTGPFTELRGVLETLPNITKWSEFRSLGARVVVGTEGTTATAELSGGYRVVFEIESVEDDRVQFKRLSLQRVERDADGKETVKNLYTNAIGIRPGTTLNVGAAKAPNSKQALFLTLQVTPR